MNSSKKTIEDLPKELNTKQKLFCKEYLIDLNATQAAIRAGYSENTAKEIAYELLTKPHIQAFIAADTKKKFKKVEITADKVLMEIAKLAFSNMDNYITFNDDGTVSCDFSKLTSEQTAAIQEITTDHYTGGSGKKAKPYHRIKFKLYSKHDSLELLGRYLSLFTDNVNHRFDNTLAGMMKMLSENGNGDANKRTNFISGRN